jgi:hypothetical protein
MKPVPLAVHLMYSPNSSGCDNKNHNFDIKEVAPELASIVLTFSSSLFELSNIGEVGDAGR